jgi:hypothetical protein
VFSVWLSVHVKWDPCHHDMVRPQVAAGGDGPHTLKVAANILNKSRPADKEWARG